MRNIKIVTILFAGLVFVVVCQQANAQLRDRDNAKIGDAVNKFRNDGANEAAQPGTVNANNAFSRKVAGTYVDVGVVAGGAFTGLQTLGADGTQTSTNTNCCGLAGNIQGAAHGAWTKTGSNQVTINSIIQIFDLSGTPFITARVQVVVDFTNNAFTAADAVLTTELWFWSPPPTTCTACPDDSGCGGVPGSCVDGICSEACGVGGSCVDGFCDNLGGFSPPDVLNTTPNLVVCGTATWEKLQVTEDAGDDCEAPGCTDLRFLFECD